MPRPSSKKHAPSWTRSQKKTLPPAPQLLLAQEKEIQQLMAQFQNQTPTGTRVQQLEPLIRAAIFKPATDLVGYLLQWAVDQIDAAYQPRPGQAYKGRFGLEVQCMFGLFKLMRDYYYDATKTQGHYPADAALGLEGGCTPALAQVVCLEGADESSYQKAQLHLAQTGGIEVSARQIQRLVQRVGPEAQRWQEREVEPAECQRSDALVLYVSADGTGISMRREELIGRVGKQADGSAKTHQVYAGCVFTQHKVDEEGHPVRDWESTTYVSSLDSIDQFGPLLRREALRRGMGTAQQVVVLIDGASGLEKMGHTCFAGCVQIVDFYHAMQHAGAVLQVLLGGKEHPQYRARLHLWAKGLLQDGVEKLIKEARRQAKKAGGVAVEDPLRYFVNNVERMQYGTFRAQGYFIGSGVVEAGCKTVIGARCKQSGMYWGLALLR